MSDHGDSFGPPRERRVFFYAICGQFQFKREKGKAVPYETTSYVEGTYLGHSVVRDDGNPAANVPAGDKLVVILSGRMGGEEAKFYIRSHYPSVFTWTFAAHLTSLVQGRRYRFAIWGGNNEKVSFCKVYEQGGEPPVEQEEGFPKIVDGGHLVADQRIRSHVAWVEPTTVFGKPKNGARPGAGRPEQDDDYYHEEERAEATPGVAGASVEDHVHESELITWEALERVPPTAFAYEFRSWPPAADLLTPGDGPLVEHLKNGLREHGIQFADIGHYVNAVRVVVGLERRDAPLSLTPETVTKAEAVLVGRVLRAGSITQLKNAVERERAYWRSQKERPSDDEYDPFADE